jgi:hypothetical protein
LETEQAWTLGTNVDLTGYVDFCRARGAEAHREVQSGTTADGFVWRKYGQKDIIGSKHPRYVEIHAG